MGIRCACAVVAGLALSASAFAECGWDTRFAAPGVANNSEVKDAIVYDAEDGNGPMLYVCGTFNRINGVSATKIARWNGTTWEPVLGGLSGTPECMTVFDEDGEGGNPGKLIVGGLLARGFNVHGSSGGVNVNQIIAFDGAEWSTLGSGVTGIVKVVRTMAVHDFGAGPRLFVGGSFTTAGGTPSRNHIAIWNGSAWSSIGNGASTGLVDTVRDIRVFDDGTGPALFISGTFTKIGTVNCTNVAKYNGTTVTTLGAGIANPVWGCAVHDFDGAGENAAELVMGDPSSPQTVYAWNGSSWRTFAPPATIVSTLYSFNGTLYAGGQSLSDGLGGYLPSAVYSYNGAGWDVVGGGLGTPAYTGMVNRLRAVDVDLGGPGGEVLFAGGPFRARGDGQRMDGFAYLNASNQWTRLPDVDAWGVTGTGSTSQVIAGDPDGPGGLNAGVVFTGNADALGPNMPAQPGTVHHFDGTTFTTLSGITVPPGGNPPKVKFVDLDGGGPNAAALLALSGETVQQWIGGSWQVIYTAAGAVITDAVMFDHDGASGDGASMTICGHSLGGVVRWDGSTWVPLGSGVTLASETAFTSLAVFDDGSGPALFAGGGIFNTEADPIRGVAKFHGGAWSSLGTGLVETGAFQGRATVQKMEGVDLDGPGGNAAKLVIVGSFDEANGSPALGVVTWDGTTLAPIGDALVHSNGVSPPLVSDIAVRTTGGSPRLVIGGSFQSVADSTIAGLATYNASTNTWEAYTDAGSLSGGAIGLCSGVAIVDEDGDEATYIVGSLDKVGETVSTYIARHVCEGAPACPADFNGDGTRDVADLFAYINAWLAKTANADFNTSGGVDVADLFAYINAWLAGC